MKPTHLGELDLANLETLIEIMGSSHLLGREDEELLRKRRMPDYLNDSKNMIEQKLAALREEPHPLAFLHGSQSDVEELLRSCSDNLAFHVKVVRDSFDYYLRSGEVPAPHYALRIAIILRRAGRNSEELCFLNSWLRHFPGNGIGSYESLQKRRDKLMTGAFPSLATNS